MKCLNPNYNNNYKRKINQFNAYKKTYKITNHFRYGCTAEAFLLCSHRVSGSDSRNPGAGETSACSVNVIRGYNSEELAGVQDELERKITHLGIEERRFRCQL